MKAISSTPSPQSRLGLRAGLGDAGRKILARTAIPQRVVARQAAELAIAPHKACVSVEAVSESEGRTLLSRTVLMKVLH
jgi:hypothetical protein